VIKHLKNYCPLAPQSNNTSNKTFLVMQVMFYIIDRKNLNGLIYNWQFGHSYYILKCLVIM